MAQLVDRFVGGEAEVFGELHALLYPRLRAFGLSIVPDGDLVDDQIQELFLWLLSRPARLQTIERLEVYLLGALRNNLHQARRKSKRRQECALRAMDTAARPLQSSPLADRIDRETEREKLDFLRQQLQSLPPRRRQVIFLRYIENHSYSEIGSMLGISPQIARNYATRALASIRSCRDEFVRIFK
jgi:RNA polymerase sigma factor (sigma-70 family)